MPFCPKCGYEVDRDDDFCRECGRNLHKGKVPAGGIDRIVCEEQPVPTGDFESDIEDEDEEDDDDDVGTVKEDNGEPEKYEYGRYGPGAFPKHVLTTGEVPLFETRPILWMRMMGPAMIVVLTCVILVVAFIYSDAKPFLYVMGVLLLAEALWVFSKWIQWRFIIYAATNRRILCQTGIISKSYVDCPLGKVQTVYLDVSIAGRMNNFGTVRVATAGESRVEIEWRNVKDPMRTQRILNEIIEKYERGGV